MHQTKDNNQFPRFSKKVYSVVREIPKGSVLTYKQVAALAGSPNAFRAVGNILNKNFDPDIPCHRVIRSDGKSGGYNRGPEIKLKKLKDEGAWIKPLLSILIVTVLSAAMISCQKKETTMPTLKTNEPEQVSAATPLVSPSTLPVNQISMKLTSTAFGDNQSIPGVYTCDGKDINPPLEISEVPEGAKSLALIVDDPDAPAGDWVHWLIWNIAPETKSVAENSTPAGAALGTTDFGRPGWGGPCPPGGTHRYFFKLYALDTKLDFPETTQKAGLEAAMVGHILTQATLVGTYRRK